MSKEPSFRSNVRKVYQMLFLVFAMCVVVGGGMIYLMVNPNALDPTAPYEAVVEIPEVIDENLIENGIHVRTGLVEADGLMEVVNNCTACHSAKIVTQNRMNTERWNATIVWMQETQNLWDLGKNQEIIVNYLVTNYPPKKKGRREVLTDIDWYELTD
ncbi:monoheme cytochrome C [Aureitalea sp. L0-47]|uniref:monoheme cytochrome C n=1 Tax=Aureitalea sp. L0-47 TaxID=2816962 RepID=UPI002238F212|nr:monoheme cytochrome C [Aureitalea sp. L0-47]MCW5519618.1 monoheme cytochrome C [Aureitalea sp. L0-47]